MEVPENLPLLAKEVERNREEGTNKEKPQEAVVDSAMTEHLLGSKGTPEDGGGEGTVDDRTGEVVLLAGCTNTGDLRHLVVEDRCADESGNEGCEHLAVEGDPGRNVDIMSKFEVLSEVESV